MTVTEQLRAAYARRGYSVAMLAVLVGVAALSSQASAFWARVQVRASHALVSQDGTWMPRFQVHFVGDANHEDTCVMVLRDTDTGALEMAAVPAGSCAPAR